MKVCKQLSYFILVVLEGAFEFYFSEFFTLLLDLSLFDEGLLPSPD
jgi:hypothetical protein